MSEFFQITNRDWARALLPATRCQSSGPLGALLSSPALGVRLPTALQVLQVQRRKGLWDRSRAGAHEAYPCTYVEYSVVCPLAPSRGGVLQLRGDPVHGTNPRRPVFTLQPLPCERAPPGLGLSSP